GTVNSQWVCGTHLATLLGLRGPGRLHRKWRDDLRSVAFSLTRYEALTRLATRCDLRRAICGFSPWRMPWRLGDWPELVWRGFGGNVAFRSRAPLLLLLAAY